MARPSLLDPDQSYTFRSYFELAYETEDVLAEFGYGFERSRLDLPEVGGDLPTFLERLVRTLVGILTSGSEGSGNASTIGGM